MSGMAGCLLGGSVIDLARVLRIVVRVLEEADVGYVVVGSTAAAAWGVVRTTRDVDIMIIVSESELVDLAHRLADSGLYVPDSVTVAGRVGRIDAFNVLDPTAGGKVDIFVAETGDAFSASRIKRRVRAGIFDVPCWVATPEDILLAKLRWRRESRSEVQWRDCVEIAAVNDLDLAYLRNWGAQLAIDDDLEELIETRAT